MIGPNPLGVPSSDIPQAVNYSAHAIDDFRRMAASFLDRAPHFSSAFSTLADMLTSAVKFLLPNRCELLDLAAIGQGHLDLLKLPYPCVALEAPWYGDRDVATLGGETLERATRRIALCWEAGAVQGPITGLDEALKRHPAGGAFVLPIFKAEGQPDWTASHGGVFVPYGLTVDDGMPKSASSASRLAVEQRAEVGLARKRARWFSVEPFVFIPETWAELTARFGSEDKVLASIMNNAHDEMLMLVQTCAVLNCANVVAAELRPPAPLNRNRLAKGKTPFFTYKMLSIELGEGGSGEGAGGTHASPRTHLRRGHIRRLSAQTVWVRPALVGSHGLVQKDYRLQPSRAKERV